MNRPHPIPLVVMSLVLAMGSGLAWQNAVATGLPAGARVLDPSQILSERTRTTNGTLYFWDGEGNLRRFLTSISDPAIRNPGDGSFHPASVAVVEDAIGSIDRRFTDRLSFATYILPYPVADPIGSWADESSIYICPGVYELSVANIHFLMSHEAGHLVHRAFLPDTDREGWARYRSMRGITDSTRYNAFAPHRDRPHEIFAEDFRVLFGSDEARAAGIENSDLADPRLVPGLKEFYLSLIENPAPAPRALAAVFPNPLGRGDVLHFAIPGSGGSADLALFDASGRKVREMQAIPSGSDGLGRFAWDGLDGSGRMLPGGIYFGTVRGSDGQGTMLRFTLRLVR